jgi:hypothetical protein
MCASRWLVLSGRVDQANLIDAVFAHSGDVGADPAKRLAPVRVRQDPEILLSAPVPPSTTAATLAARFERAHREGLEQAGAGLTGRALATVPVAERARVLSGRVTINLDAKDIEVFSTRKEQVVRSYKGEIAGRVHAAHWSQAQVVLVVDLLDGRSDGRTEGPAQIDRAVDAVRVAGRARSCSRAIAQPSANTCGFGSDLGFRSGAEVRVGGDAAQRGLPEAVLEAGQGLCREQGVAVGQGVGDRVLGLDQYVDHGLGPGRRAAGVLGDGDQFAQNVRAAQRLGVTLAGGGGQGVVRDAGEGGQDREVVHGRPAASGVDAVEGDQVGAHHVQPVQRVGHPHPGLIEYCWRAAEDLHHSHPARANWVPVAVSRSPVLAVAEAKLTVVRHAAPTSVVMGFHPRFTAAVHLVLGDHEVGVPAKPSTPA